MRLFLAVLQTSLCAVLLSVSATAGTIVVDNDFADCPQADFNSIQAAVLAASPGDKILVCPGTYVETVLVEKNDLRIEAQAAPGDVILQAPTPETFAGFHLNGVTGVVLEGFQVQGFHEANILLTGGGDNAIRGNIATLSAHHDGIEVIGSSRNIIEHNLSFNNPGPSACGVNIIAGSNGNIVRHNEVYGNAFGAQVVNGVDNEVADNDSHNNRIVGIRTVGAVSGTSIKNNTVHANPTGMLLAAGSTGVTLSQNESEANTLNGIRVLNSLDNVVEKNDVHDNGLSGISLENGDANLVQLNRSDSNGLDGIRADSLSGGNTIQKNHMENNAEHDAHDDSAGSGTGGTANAWINNKCETESRPGLCKHQ